MMIVDDVYIIVGSANINQVPMLWNFYGPKLRLS
jgi:phosphatidylserine/phosphatidylglycerophosphate/cardiolipin synthase-like enzyme